MKASSEDGMKEEPQRAPQRKSILIYAREGHGPVWKVMNQSLSFLTWYGGYRRENEFEPKMAGLERKLSGEGDELPRCSTLFVTEDGSQMNFYMTPCAMKTRLRPLIHVSLRKALTCKKFYIACLSSVYNSFSRNVSIQKLKFHMIGAFRTHSK